MSSYDLSPTTRLGGVHMAGVVRRRFLISYSVEPSLLAPFVPTGGELSLYNGMAWVSACFVDLADMRPSFVPKGLGSQFLYLIHRTRAKLPYPDGELRESVLVLEPNMNKPLLARLGRASTGVNFRVRDFAFEETVGGWSLRMSDGMTVLFEAEIARNTIGDTLPKQSRFENAKAADDFLLGVAYGGEWNRNSGRLRLLAETHEPWKTYVGACETKRYAFLEGLGVAQPRADHVITMTDIPHYFGLRGFDVSCPTKEPAAAGVS